MLPFIAERRAGVRATAVESVTLPVPGRRIDSVLRLERDGLVKVPDREGLSVRGAHGRTGIAAADFFAHPQRRALEQ